MQRPRSRPLRPLPTPLTVAIAFVHLLALSPIFVIAQDSTPSPSPTPFPDGLTGKALQASQRLASFSTAAPFTTFFASNPDVASQLPRLHQLVRAVDTVVTNNTLTASPTDPSTSQRQEDADAADDPSNKLTTCNHRDDDWNKEIPFFHQARGLAPPDGACISDVHTNSISRSYDTSTLAMTEDDAYRAVSSHAHSLRDAAKPVIATMRRDPDMRAQLVNWTDPTGPADFSYIVRDQRCKFDHAAFVRHAAHWYLLVSLTNKAQDVVREDGQREYLHEFVRLGDEARTGGPPRPVIAKKVVSFGDNHTEAPWVRDTTTLRQFDKGAVTASAFAREFPRDNLAVQEALRRGEHHTQQASDATTLSNIAILAFPLVMNAVPVALIADVNTIGMLAYTLLTDVLTAVPLAIKGVEVLNIGQQRNRAVIVRITGGNLPGPGVESVPSVDGRSEPEPLEPVRKAAEVWVAECRPTGSLRATGISLLAVALAFMVGGIVAEVWARDYVRRRKKAAAAAAALSGTHTGPHGGMGLGVPTNAPASVIALTQRPAPLDEPAAHNPGGAEDGAAVVANSGTAAAAYATHLTNRPPHATDGDAQLHHVQSNGSVAAAHVALTMAGIVATESVREARRSQVGRGGAGDGDADVEAGGEEGRKVE